MACSATRRLCRFYSLVWRAGRVGWASHARAASHLVRFRTDGTLAYAGSEIWEPLKASLFWNGHRRHTAALIACALAWASRRSMAWRIVALGR